MPAPEALATACAASREATGHPLVRPVPPDVSGPCSRAAMSGCAAAVVVLEWHPSAPLYTKEVVLCAEHAAQQG